jgi:hypothetical protein
MLAFPDVMAALHVLTLCRLVLTVTVVATPVAAFAQATRAPPTDLHRYPLPTYEEDWRALQGGDRTDLWEPVDNTAGGFDDGSHHSFDVWGVYGCRFSSGDIRASPWLEMQAYCYFSQACRAKGSNRWRASS